MLVNDVNVLEGVVTMELLGHTGGLPRYRYPGHFGARDQAEGQELSASLKSAYGSSNNMIHGARDPIVCICEGLSLRPAHKFARNAGLTLRTPASQAIHRRP